MTPFQAMRYRQLAAAGGGDPYFANVVALLHFDGANGSTTITDQIGHTFTANGAAAISTAQSVFGGASGLFPGAAGDCVDTPTSADWAFGSGDFTLEGRSRFTSVAGVQFVISKISTISGFGPFVLTTNSGVLQFFASSNDSSWDVASAVSLGSISNGTWHAWAISRVGTTIYTFLDGVAGATATSSASLTVNGETLRISGRNDGSFPMDGYNDEFRITKGVGRYSAGYTPAASAFPNS